MNESELFDQNPEVVSGALVFKGTRVPVDVLFENLAAGLSLEDIHEDFPAIGRERAKSAIRLAYRRLAQNFKMRRESSLL